MLQKMREKLQQVLAPPVSSPHDRHEKIAQRAYQLYEEGGCVSGNDTPDWLKAEKEIAAFRHHWEPSKTQTITNKSYKNKPSH